MLDYMHFLSALHSLFIFLVFQPLNFKFCNYAHVYISKYNYLIPNSCYQFYQCYFFFSI